MNGQNLSLPTSLSLLIFIYQYCMCAYDLYGWTRAWHGAYEGDRGQLICSLLHLLVNACMSSAFFTHWATSLPWLLPSLSSLPRSFPLHHQLLSYWSEPAHRPYLSSSPHSAMLGAKTSPEATSSLGFFPPLLFTHSLAGSPLHPSVLLQSQVQNPCLGLCLREADWLHHSH